MKQYKALIAIDVTEGNGKVEFFLVIHAEDSNKARAIAEREYPSGQIRFVVQVGMMGEQFFKNHYAKCEEVYYTESDENNAVEVATKKEMDTMNDAVHKANIRHIDVYGSALDIMNRFGGAVDSVGNHIFCQVNAFDNPDAFDKIVCMTRKLVDHVVTHDEGAYKILFFRMK